MTISVVRDRTQAMRHIVHIGNHQIPVDGTIEDGGLDSGPPAHDLYDAALGACKALTLVWYARRKSIVLDDVRVRVERDASAGRQGVYRLGVFLTLAGELNEAQRRELLSVAGRCPVHKLMTAVKTEISTAFE